MIKKNHTIACLLIFFVAFFMIFNILHLCSLRKMTYSLRTIVEKERIKMEQANITLINTLRSNKQNDKASRLVIILPDAAQNTLNGIKDFYPKSSEKINLPKKRRSWKELTSLAMENKP